MKTRTVIGCSGALLLGGACVFLATRKAGALPEPPRNDDAALVRSLLDENLSKRTFAFATVAEACSGTKVLPLGDSEAERRVVSAIGNAVAETIAEMNREDAPVRKLRRINEASRFFEDGMRERLDAIPGLNCEVPPTRSGERQRSGYPDLRLADEETGRVFYLDPKLVERGSVASTFRTFYFEPKNETLKITEDATHLLVGIEHDGATGRWTFSGWRLVDLSALRVRLKAEFQASNAELYGKTALSLPAGSR
jgi:hypothetical protein